MDKAIRNEMLKYEEAEFYIRLQSECFNLYPIVVKALALQIIDNKRRSIFCSIVKGHKLKRLADFHKQTPEEIAIEFRSIVCELRCKINNGAFTAKESVNLRLKMERDILEHKIRDYDELCQRLQLKNKILHDQLDMLRDNQKRHSKDEQEITHEKEQEIIRKTRKALLEGFQPSLTRVNKTLCYCHLSLLKDKLLIIKAVMVIIGGDNKVIIELFLVSIITCF